jgi:hypothetical protein
VAVPVVDVITNEREPFICNHVNKRYCQAGITDQKNIRRYHHEKKVMDLKSSDGLVLSLGAGCLRVRNWARRVSK